VAATSYGGVVETLPPLGVETMPEGPLKPNEEDESVLIDIDAEVDNRLRDERRKRESVEFCADDDEELRVRVCIGTVCGWRLKPLRRGRRIFRDGVVGVVIGDLASAEGGVEGNSGRAARGGAGLGGLSVEGCAGASTVTGAKGFCLTAEPWSFLSLGRKLREPRPTSVGFDSGCTIYR
jgi:hypothetical protein